MTVLRANFRSALDTPLVAPGNLPTIRIRRTDTQALVVTDAAMTEQGEGNFTFDFNPTHGLEYVIRADGDPLGTGQTLIGERFAHGSVTGDTTTDIIQTWNRAGGGTRLEAIIKLMINGEYVNLPGTATLDVVVRDSTGSLQFAQSGVNPNAEGFFAVTENPFSPGPGTNLAAFATITDGQNVYQSVTGLASAEF